MKRIFQLLVLPALGVLAPHNSQANEVQLTDCPQAVQETIRSNSRGGKVDEIDVVKSSGVSLYIAEIELADKKDLKLHIGEQGNLLVVKEEIALADLPQAVKDAANKLAGDAGKLSDPEKETTNGRSTYLVEIERQGQPDLDVSFSESGEILNQTQETN